MLLSQKLNQLREDTNEVTGFSDEMMDGFNRCIEDAEFLESREKLLREIENKISDMYAEDSESDLCDIGEYIATKLGFL